MQLNRAAVEAALFELARRHAAAPEPSLEHSRSPGRRALSAGRSFGWKTPHHAKPVRFGVTKLPTRCARGQHKPLSAHTDT